jgi:BMFP domain-containing protein YqiC
METLLRVERERNDALEQRLRQLEVFLTSMGVSHVSLGAQQSPLANGVVRRLLVVLLQV